MSPIKYFPGNGSRVSLFCRIYYTFCTISFVQKSIKFLNLMSSKFESQNNFISFSKTSFHTSMETSRCFVSKFCNRYCGLNFSFHMDTFLMLVAIHYGYKKYASLPPPENINQIYGIFGKLAKAIYVNIYVHFHPLHRGIFKIV